MLPHINYQVLNPIVHLAGLVLPYIVHSSVYGYTRAKASNGPNDSFTNGRMLSQRM